MPTIRSVMPPLALLSALTAATLATSFLSGVLGMAGGLVLMGVLLALFPVAQAMVLHGIAQLASNGWRAILWRRSIDWRCVLGYAAGGAVATTLFVTFQVLLPRAWVLLALGALPFLVALLPRSLRLDIDQPGQPFACGLVSITLQLLCGVSGAVLDSFFVASRMDRRAVVATKACVQTLGHALKIAYFGLLLPGAALPHVALTALLVVCAMAGTTLSRRVLEGMSDAGFRAWTRRAIYTVSLFYLGAGAWTLAR